MVRKNKKADAAYMRKYRKQKKEESKIAQAALQILKRETEGKPLLQKKWRVATDSEGSTTAVAQISKPLQRCIAMRVKRYGETEQNAFATCNALFWLPGVKEAFANLDIKKITDVWMQQQKVREAYDSAKKRDLDA